MSKPYGLLGRSLGHSYSPVIHRELAGLDYVLFEREPEELEAFLRGDEWAGLNVSIPYKKTVAGMCDELSPLAQRLGNVNTVVRRADGSLYGHNTDYEGFSTMAETMGVELSGRKVVVFGGDGGVGTTVMHRLADVAADAVAVTLDGPDNYSNLERHADATFAVNCTPVGMYPDCPASVVSLDTYPDLEGLIDVVYNPARTGLAMQAEERGIPCRTGLLMLVAQAAHSEELFCGEKIPLERIEDVAARLSAAEQNVALIGMPGCGKTRVGEQLSQILGREHVDIDHALEARLGTSCSNFIKTRGEEAFRREETALLADVAKRSRLVISCGGGVVTRQENYPLLHQNSQIVMLDRPLDELSTKGRPLSERDGVYKLAEERMPAYRGWADLIVHSTDSARHTAEKVAAELPPALEL